MEELKPQPKSEEFTILIEKTDTIPTTVTIKQEQESPGPPSPVAEEVHEKCIIQNEFEVIEDHIITYGNETNKNTVFVPRTGSEDDSNPIGDSGSDLSDTEVSYRPVRPVERQKMRPWLFDLLDKENVPGLSWQNRSQRIFRISWKHAAHNCFDRNTDSDLFERWAHHTGRRHEGNHKRWKANFRCALNSLPDVIELRDLGVRKGNNAFKVYKFIDMNDKKAKDKTKVYSISDGEFKVKEKIKQQQTPNVPGLRSRTAATRQSTTQPNSPSGQNVLTADSGMLQTLLHAIELKNMEAAQKDMEDDDTKSSVKRAASAENAALRIKRRKKETSKKKSQDDSSDISDTENSSNCQDSNQSGVSEKPLTGTDTPVASPPPGQNQQFISVLPMKIPHLGVSQVLVPCHVTTSKAKSELTATETKTIGNTPTSFSIPANLFAASQVTKSQQPATPVSSTASTSTSAATYMKNISSYLTAQIVGVGRIEGQQLVQAQSLTPKVSATATSATGEKQKFEVTIPYTVLEALKSKQLAAQEANKTTSKSEDSQSKKEASTGTTVTQSSNPINSIPKLEVNKDVTSIAAALRMPLSQSSSGLPIISTAYSLTGSDIRSKLVSRLNTNAVSRPILVSVPSTQTIRPKLDKVTLQEVSHLLGANVAQIKVADASKLIKDPSSRSPSNASTPVTFLDQADLSNTPSAVVQPVEQLSDINVSINNVDDITYVGSGRSTPSQTPAEMIEVTETSHPSSSCTPDTRPEYLTEQVTINLDKISDDQMSAEIVEEGIHITTQQSTRRPGTSPSLPQVLRTRSVMTQNNFAVVKNINSHVNQSRRSSSSEELAINGNHHFSVPSQTKVKDSATQCSLLVVDAKSKPEASLMEVTGCNGKSGQMEDSSLGNIVTTAIRILSSSQYSSLSHKVVSPDGSDKFLVIRNDRYFGVFGEDVDPMAITLSTKGLLTIQILFQSLQKENLTREDGELDEDKFSVILSNVTSYVFCPGIEKDKTESLSKIEKGISEIKRPFQRYQSESCPVWYKGQEENTNSLLQTCSSCLKAIKDLKCT